MKQKFQIHVVTKKLCKKEEITENALKLIGEFGGENKRKEDRLILIFFEMILIRSSNILKMINTNITADILCKYSVPILHFLTSDA